MKTYWEPLSETIKRVKLLENSPVLYPRLEAMARAQDLTNRIAWDSTSTDRERDFAVDQSNRIKKAFDETILLGGVKE